MRWCSGDDQLVMRGTPAWGAAAVARLLRLTERAVAQRAEELGAVVRPWTDEERELLIELWPGRRVAQLAAMFVRSPEEIVTEADRLGLISEETHMYAIRWGADEIALMRKDYHRLGPTRMAALLERPLEGVQGMAQTLGLTKSKSPDWTDAEDKTLLLERARNVAWIDIAAQLGRSYDAVRARYRLLVIKSEDAHA